MRLLLLAGRRGCWHCCCYRGITGRGVPVLLFEPWRPRVGRVSLLREVAPIALKFVCVCVWVT